ncbi:hypothetical protein DV735_g1448, partial [Chaetothyriales sp. CBS 134920]
MPFDTPLTRKLGIRIPVVQGGLQWVAYAELAAAVSNAGGLGIINALTQPDPEALRQEIRKTRSLTKNPFGVNITLLPALNPPDYPAFTRTIIEEGVKIVETAGNSPGPVIRKLKEAGIIVIHKATTIRHAKAAIKLGVDILSIDGFECAGHVGESDIASLILNSRARQELGDTPFIASGGFADGYGLVAALSLGAAGINMGTRFVCTVEAPVHINVKQAIVDGDEHQTTLILRRWKNTSRMYSNSKTAKAVEIEKTSTTGEFAEVAPVVSGARGREVLLGGDIEHGVWYVGQVMGLIHDIPTVAEVLARVEREAGEVLRNLSNSEDVEDVEDVMKLEEKRGQINPSFSSQTERETLRKLDILLIPTTCMLYFLAFLDRANLGNARVAGLQTQLALTVTYVPYIAAELPSNLIMKKVGPRFLLPAAGIVEMDGVGGMEGWRWIFCLEGIFTVLFGIGAFFLLPNSPKHVLGFKPQHVECCEERLLLDIQTREPESTAFDARKAASTLTSLHVWLVSIVQLSGGTCVFGLAYFTPSIVASLAASMASKPSRAEVQLLTTPPFAIAFICAVAVSYLSDRYRRRGLTGACVSCLAVIGWALFLTSPPNDVGRRYTALILAVVGSYATAPTYRLANKLNLALSSVAVVGIVAEMCLLHYLNERKKRMRDVILKDVAHLDPHEQYEALGDRHPDFKYTL